MVVEEGEAKEKNGARPGERILGQDPVLGVPPCIEPVPNSEQVTEPRLHFPNPSRFEELTLCSDRRSLPSSPQSRLLQAPPGSGPAATLLSLQTRRFPNRVSPYIQETH